MRTYSMDLRERVVAAAEQGDLTLAEVAALFGVSLAWVKRLRQRLKATGSLAPLAGGRGPEPKLGDRGHGAPPLQGSYSTHATRPPLLVSKPI